MAFYVYILQSEQDCTFYKGASEHPGRRLAAHNAGESRYTSAKTPWKLVYVEEMGSKKEMLIREKKLKRGKRAYFEQLIASEKNIAVNFTTG